MSLVFIALIACDVAAEPEDACVSDIAETACDEERYRTYKCDACGQNWGCSTEGWFITDVDCECISEEGRRDTALPGCRITY
jgi:hypothetical protein